MIHLLILCNENEMTSALDQLIVKVSQGGSWMRADGCESDVLAFPPLVNEKKTIQIQLQKVGSECLNHLQTE